MFHGVWSLPYGACYIPSPPMPVALRKLHAGLNLEQAQEQVRAALRLVFKLCGGQSAFVRRLNERLAASGQKGVSQPAVSFWVSEGVFIDKRYWSLIEEFTDMAVTRRALRPDLYGIGWVWTCEASPVAASSQAAAMAGGASRCSPA